MPDDLVTAAGPAVSARLLADAALPLHSPARPLSEGFLAAPCDHGISVLDRSLRISGHFPIPDGVARRLRHSEAPVRVDVSPDHRWAVLADARQMTVVDQAGYVAWERSYPSFIDDVGDPMPACGAFSPDGSELWAFMPVPGISGDTGDEGTERAQRWVLKVSDWQIASRADSRYRGFTDILVHPRERLLGYGSFDANGAAGLWTPWDGTDEPARIQGAWFPLGVSADGRRWLGGVPRGVVVADFEGAEIRMNQDGEWDHWDFTLDAGACFLHPDHVLVHAWHDSGESRHLLLRADTLEPVGHIRYPAPQ